MQPIRLFTLIGASVVAALAAGALFQPETRVETAEAPDSGIAAAGHGSLLALGRADRTETDSASVTGQACDPAIRIAAGPAAMLTVQLSAPCDPGKTVTLAHGPISLTEQLGPDGQLTMNLPALAPEAEVTAALADGRRMSATAEVPDFQDFARLVVDWTGPFDLDLHAYVGDAAWGDTGHARAGGPVSARGGFITALGSDGASQTRVYTYPAGLAPYSAQIAVEAEIAITPASCGRSLQARVHMIRTEAPVGLRGIEVQMPACGTPGGFVLLHDLLPGDPLDFAALNLAGRN